MRQIMNIDTTNGPRMIVRHTFNFKPLLIALLAILLCCLYVLTVAALAEPNVEVSCQNGILVFRDLEIGEDVAWVEHANAEQLEQIKKLAVTVDPSVDNFIPDDTEGRYFEIKLDGEMVCSHADNYTSYPSKYNGTINSDKLAKMLEASSRQTNFLYEDLGKIFTE